MKLKILFGAILCMFWSGFFFLPVASCAYGPGLQMERYPQVIPSDQFPVLAAEKLEAVLEEQGETRDGYFFPEKMISEKVYKCNFLAPEYLCDVMRLIRLSDHVVLVDQYGNTYRCDTFLCTPKWQEQGNLANVEVEFTCNTVVKKIGKQYVEPGTDDDFNIDFNNDFDIMVEENDVMVEENE
jgi:hypothetical protein